MNPLASEVISWGHTKVVAILLVKLNPGIHLSWLSSITFLAVNLLNCGSKPLAYDRVHIYHPKPQGGLEWYIGISSHSLGWVQAIKSNALSSGTVVIVPGQLKRATAIVLLPLGTWVLRIVFIITIVIGLVALFYEAQICLEGGKKFWLCLSEIKFLVIIIIIIKNIEYRH